MKTLEVWISNKISNNLSIIFLRFWILLCVYIYIYSFFKYIGKIILLTFENPF